MNEENKNTEEQTTEENKDEVKTYTEEEVASMLQKEADRRVSQALAKQKAQFEKEKAEADKLKDMDEAQRKEYDLEQRLNSIKEREKEIALKENRMEASNVMLKRGLPIDFVDYVVAGDAETMLENINTFEKAFKAAVQEAVNKKVSTPPPGAGRASKSNTLVTKEQFNKMTLAQQSELYRNDPELFKVLSSN